MSINTHLTILVGVLMLAIGGIIASTLWVTHTQEADLLVINMAGRQRMLTQKYAKEVLLETHSRQEFARAELSDDKIEAETIIKAQDRNALRQSTVTAQLFEKSHAALRQGGETFMDLAMTQTVALPPTLNPRILKHLEKIEGLWDGVMEAARGIDSGKVGVKSYTESLRALPILVNQCLEEMDLACRWYQKESESKVEMLAAIQYGFGLVSLITFSVLAFYIRRKVSPPLKEAIYLAKAIEQAEESVVVTDHKANIQYVNPAFERNTGYIREDVLGKNPRFLQSGQHSHTFYEQIWAKLMRGETWKGQFINKKRDGTLFTESTSISPVRDAFDRIESYVSVRHDITRRREMEAQLRQAQKMEAIGTLAGGIAHDFNNILVAIIGYTELALLSIDRGNKSYEYIEEVEKASLRAKDLVSQILAFSRQVDLERKPIQLHEIIEDALNLMQKAIPSSIKFKSDISHDCHWVLADATQIHQVTMNLCTNAYHAMRDHEGTLSVRLDETRIEAKSTLTRQNLPEGLYVRLSVSDTGHGLDQATIDRIFEPYFTTKEVGYGTGLGLSTVFSIVEEHGGAITVESKPGEGSEFAVYLPICSKAQSLDEPTPKNLDVPISSGKGKCILLVDDEPAIVRLYKRSLTDLGYEVKEHTNSLRALADFRSNPDGIDLVITDQTMPQLSGIELIEKILHIRANMPILLCSGFSETVTREGALAAGAREFIRKPISPKDLAFKISSWLDEGVVDSSEGS